MVKIMYVRQNGEIRMMCRTSTRKIEHGLVADSSE